MRINDVSRIHKTVNFNARIDKELESSLKKITTGKRINVFSDDVASMNISSKFSNQIKGLNQANSNIDKGISLIKVADSSLENIQEITLKIRELVVQAGSNIYTKSERFYIQQEINNYIEKIDEIVNDAKFSDIPVLKGNMGIVTQEVIKGQLPGINVPTSLNKVDNDYSYGEIDFSSIRTQTDLSKLINTGFHTTCCSCDKKYSINFVEANSSIENLLTNPILNIDIRNLNNLPDDLVSRVEQFFNSNISHFTGLKANGGKLIIYDNRQYVKPQVNSGYGIMGSGVVHTVQVDKSMPFYVQTGANSKEDMEIFLAQGKHDDIKRLKDLNIENIDDIFIAFDIIDGAINHVANERVRMGTYQNKLETALSNVITTYENYMGINSSIEDVDIAQEYVSLARSRVLSQSSISTISKHMQFSEQILKLLS